jgi:hypothetical protein
MDLPFILPCVRQRDPGTQSLLFVRLGGESNLWALNYYAGNFIRLAGVMQALCFLVGKEVPQQVGIGLIRRGAGQGWSRGICGADR